MDVKSINTIYCQLKPLLVPTYWWHIITDDVRVFHCRLENEKNGNVQSILVSDGSLRGGMPPAGFNPVIVSLSLL